MDKASSCYQRYLEGDENAPREIMDELFYGLVFFTDRIVHDVHAAEDIALDVMADLFVHKHRYDFRTSLKTYVYMRAKSRALDHLRRCRWTNLTELSEAEAYPDERAELERRVLENERKRAVNSAVEALPAEMRAAVHLVCFDGMSYAEAAKVMGKNRKQIDNLLFRAKKELAASLGEEGRALLGE